MKREVTSLNQVPKEVDFSLISFKSFDRQQREKCHLL